MFYPLPSNVLPYVVGFPVFLFFGFRGFQNYRKLHNPLSKYFAYSGLFAGLAFFFWSVPFLFTRDLNTLILLNAIGDLCLYIMLVLQAVVVHYLALKGRVSIILILVPIIAIAVIGWLGSVYGYLQSGVEVVSNKAVYELPMISNIAQLILLVNVLLVGILLLTRITQQKTSYAKAGLVSIAFLYLLSGVGGALNVIISGDANQSPLIIGSYIVGFLLFSTLLLYVRIVRKPSR